MISKKKFKDYIEFLKNYEKKIENANDALQEISTEFSGIYGIASPIVEQYVYMLTDLMGLTKVDEELLWWWMYEQDFGAGTAKVFLGKKTYYLKTPEDLYDFIIKEIKNYERKRRRKNGR